MASVPDLCNTALSHLGAEAVVSSISPPDGSAEAGYCARFYPLARQLALTSANWQFAKARVLLAELVNDSTEWAYKYQLPSDCLHPRKVLTGDVYDNPERGGATFEVEGDALFTNQPEAVLIYTVDVTDTSKFPADFTMALGQLLAGYLAGPIIKGVEGMRVGEAWLQRGTAALARAFAREANGSKESAEHTPAAIKARL